MNLHKSPTIAKEFPSVTKQMISTFSKNQIDGVAYVLKSIARDNDDYVQLSINVAVEILKQLSESMDSDITLADLLTKCTNK